MCVCVCVEEIGEPICSHLNPGSFWIGAQIHGLNTYWALSTVPFISKECVKAPSHMFSLLYFTKKNSQMFDKIILTQGSYPSFF